MNTLISISGLLYVILCFSKISFIIGLYCAFALLCVYVYGAMAPKHKQLDLVFFTRISKDEREKAVEVEFATFNKKLEKEKSMPKKLILKDQWEGPKRAKTLCIFPKQQPWRKQVIGKRSIPKLVQSKYLATYLWCN